MKHIIELNILIAKFMGWEVDNTFPDKDRVYRFKSSLELDTTFKYHKSWDNLMPVVDKIEMFNNGLNGIYGSGTIPLKIYINKNDDLEYTSKIKFNQVYKFIQTYDNRLDAVFHTVVEFIKWYNKIII